MGSLRIGAGYGVTELKYAGRWRWLIPRAPRVFVEGGIYHVYNRFASGEAVFADPEGALKFIELFRFVK